MAAPHEHTPSVHGATPRRHRRHRLLVVAVVAFAMLAAACGDDDDASSGSTPASEGTTATTGAADTSGSADATDVTGATGDEAASSFPVTIEHAFGETTIAEEPVRVVTFGWGSADAAIALGVVPVAIPFQAYGGDESGVLPWIREELESTGQPIPTVLPDVPEGVPFEAIAAADPDVILAVYSGITESEYGLLSDIAPTVAYPGEAWATPWRDTISTVATALGRDAEAVALLEDIDEQVAAQADAHPELAGKSIAMVWDVGGTFYVYKPADPRVQFAVDLGMVSAPSVDELATDESTFFFTLSYEELGSLTSDILLNFADTPELSQAFLVSDPAQLMAQVQEGRVAEVTGIPLIASVSPPTALSVTWALEDYVAILSAAAQAADAAG